MNFLLNYQTFTNPGIQGSYNNLLHLQNLRGLFYDHSDLSLISQIRQMFAFY